MNSGGTGNKIILKDTGRIEREEDDEKKHSFRVFKFSGAHEVDHVFASESAMLIFQMEYHLILNGPQSTMPMDYVVGYLPVYISDKFGIREQVRQPDKIRVTHHSLPPRRYLILSWWVVARVSRTNQ